MNILAINFLAKSYWYIKCSSHIETDRNSQGELGTKKGRHPMKNTSQPNPTPSGVLGTVAKLIRLTEKEDVEWSHWQHPTNNVTARRNLAEYLKTGCPKVSNNGEVATNQLPEGHELARLILGDDYITPEEVATAYGVRYTDEQLEHFADTLPDTQTILWLRANGYMLIAGPSTEMNLLQVRKLDNQLFYSKTEGWYAKDKEKFAKDDTAKAGEWLAIRKDEVPNSFNKTWKEQQDLITEVEHVPNAPEVSYAVTAYFKVRDIYLLRGKYVRTSSVSAGGDRVHVGDFDGDGLDVNDYWDGNRGGRIGVSSARK
jgi:hypothetical protein